MTQTKDESINADEMLCKFLDGPNDLLYKRGEYLTRIIEFFKGKYCKEEGDDNMNPNDININIDDLADEHNYFSS